MKRSDIQIRILSGSSFEELQAEVNSWLAMGEESDCEILSITYHPGDSDVIPTVCIVYDINEICSGVR